MDKIRDLHSAITVENGRTANVSGNTTSNGAIIDLQGCGWVVRLLARAQTHLYIVYQL